MEMNSIWVSWFPPLLSSAPITPTFLFGFSCEVVGDYVEKQILAHRFSHYYSWRCRRMMSTLAGAINPSMTTCRVMTHCTTTIGNDARPESIASMMHIHYLKGFLAKWTKWYAHMRWFLLASHWWRLCKLIHHGWRDSNRKKNPPADC